MLVYSAAWPHSAAGAHPTHAWMVVMVVVVQGEVMEGGSVIIHVFVEIVRFDIVVLEASLATLIELARWVVQIGQLHNLDLILQVKITWISILLRLRSWRRLCSAVRRWHRR